MKPLFVIMVTYRRFDYFKRTCESLIPTLPQGSKMVIVVNGELTPEYTSYLNEIVMVTAPSAVTFEILYTGTNEGWGAGMNIGLLEFYSKWTEYDYVLESNNDVEYEPDWFEKSKVLMEKYSKIGILALWKHIHHGTRNDIGDMLIMDNAPAVAWLFRSADLEELLPFVENGPAKNRGGNGEDIGTVLKCQNIGLWVASPKQDLAHHMDGYDPELGKDNPAYL